MSPSSPDRQTILLERLYALAWDADVVKSTEAQRAAQREIDELCRQHRFLARERARMVKELARTRVVLAQRARRGEPLVPIKVIKANGRVRKFGPSGRAPRRACNARRRGSVRSAVRSGQDPGDPDLDPPDADQALPVGRRA